MNASAVSQNDPNNTIGETNMKLTFNGKEYSVSDRIGDIIENLLQRPDASIVNDQESTPDYMEIYQSLPKELVDEINALFEPTKLSVDIPTIGRITQIDFMIGIEPDHLRPSAVDAKVDMTPPDKIDGRPVPTFLQQYLSSNIDSNDMFYGLEYDHLLQECLPFQNDEVLKYTQKVMKDKEQKSVEINDKLTDYIRKQYSLESDEPQLILLVHQVTNMFAVRNWYGTS